MTKLFWAPLLLLAATPVAGQEERTVDPSFMHRYVPAVKETKVAISSPTAHYKALFGDGDSNTKVLRSVSRYGELTVDANGRSALVKYPKEEHLLVILEGEGQVVYGGKPQAVKVHDFMYLPPGVEFGLNGGGKGIKAMVMGFKIPDSMMAQVKPSPTLQIANYDDVKLQPVGTHPMSTLYRLMIGDTTSTRDRLASAHVMISLYVMEFDTGGTNFPHHHETQEEIYLLLDGNGEMVAGGGMNGVEGKFRAKPGDAYYYRANTTVGFYNDKTGARSKPARILAVRSNIPLNK